MRTVTAVLYRERTCTSRSARRSAPPGKAVANLKGATELYLEGFPLKDGRRPIIAVLEANEGARA